MIDPEKAVRRISMRRVMQALGLEFDGRIGVCPKCGRRTLRYIPNANRVRCRTCFRRPSTNIDLVMRVRGVPRDEAMRWIKALVDDLIETFDTPAEAAQAAAQGPRIRAQASPADLTDIAQALRNMDEGFAQLAQAYNHKRKMKDKAPAFVAMCAAAGIYARASADPGHIPAGTVERELVAHAMRTAGARVISPRRLREAWKDVKRIIAAELLRGNPVSLRTGEPFCVNRHILLPLYNHEGVVIGMAASDCRLEQDALLLVAEAGRTATNAADARRATIAQSVRDALRMLRNGTETWMLHPRAPSVRIRSTLPVEVPEWAEGRIKEEEDDATKRTVPAA